MCLCVPLPGSQGMACGYAVWVQFKGKLVITVLLLYITYIVLHIRYVYDIQGGQLQIIKTFLL